MHRENGPAVEDEYGGKQWYRHGRRHRENGPAIEYADGEKHWYIYNQCHREDGPAVEYPNGTVQYYLHGETGPEIEEQVKENMARIQAKKEQEELLNEFSHHDEISVKMNKTSTKITKKL